MGGPFQTVPALKFIVLDFEIPKMPTQAVQFVATLRCFGAELAHGGRRSLSDGCESAFEIEAAQPFPKRAQLIKQRSVRGIVLRLDSLDDAAFNVIEPAEAGVSLRQAKGIDP